MPIWAQPGPGGGYGLNVETTLPPLNLTAAEAAAIATALAATRALPFAEAGHSALRKLTAVMASDPRDSAARLVQHIRVAQGPATPGDRAAGVIEKALIESRALEITYRDAEGSETRRIVEPAGIVGSHNGWYLVGWCRMRQAARSFRLDRIVDTCVLEERIALRPLNEMLPEFPFEVAEPALSA
ncbi:MAG: WYL domain-containing protein [Chloroflexi bacterium]|nr:WYL domain-containing protein [Chloroflexota bacterium]